VVAAFERARLRANGEVSQSASKTIGGVRHGASDAPAAVGGLCELAEPL
jgi:hypothetical protein